MRLKFLEIFAIASNLAYTLLYLSESNWAWLCAILGALAYFWLCKSYNLVGESWLQIFYLAAALFGWWAPVSNFDSHFDSLKLHLVILGGTVLLWLVAKRVLVGRKTSFPWLDSFALVFGITGTVLQVLYSPVNWYYFLLVNGVSAYTYWNKGMKLSLILYLIYFLLSLQGIFYSISS